MDKNGDETTAPASLLEPGSRTGSAFLTRVVADRSVVVPPDHDPVQAYRKILRYADPRWRQLVAEMNGQSPIRRGEKYVFNVWKVSLGSAPLEEVRGWIPGHCIRPGLVGAAHAHLLWRDLGVAHEYPRTLCFGGGEPDEFCAFSIKRRFVHGIGAYEVDKLDHRGTVIWGDFVVTVNN
jgi:hypothetical protein